MCLVGDEFNLPTLTPYEAMIALGAIQPWWENSDGSEASSASYPMDYYAKDGGAWNSSYHKRSLKPKPVNA